MIKLDKLNLLDNESKYKFMVSTIKAQLDSEKDSLCNLSNVSSIIKAFVEDINWAGFYVMRNGELVLGPFQGLPACNRIKIQTGVCGKAVRDKKCQIVKNVHEFEGHIPCDENTNSEIVIPIIKNGEVKAVLDIDSESFNRFNELESKYLNQVANELIHKITWENI